jgi:hypothetical protein
MEVVSMVEGFMGADSTVEGAMVAGDMEEDTDKGERLAVRWGEGSQPRKLSGWLPCVLVPRWRPAKR